MTEKDEDLEQEIEQTKKNYEDKVQDLQSILNKKVIENQELDTQIKELKAKMTKMELQTQPGNPSLMKPLGKLNIQNILISKQQQNIIQKLNQQQEGRNTSQ